ncbi:MAG: hypothetical protein JNM41_16080 [Flavipsychrobacter sp.]|nr:hypothetical protein [Flavipsychrobacter sp.]
MRKFKTIFAYTVLVVGLLVMVAASSKSFVFAVWDWHNKHGGDNKWYMIYHSPWGDLVSQANLDNEKKYLERKNYTYDRPADCGKGNVALYILGDSYTRDIPDSVFCNVTSLEKSRVTQACTFRPKKGAKNVLIIEMTERYIREMLHVTKDFSIPPPANSSAAGGADGVKSYAAFMNRNLEYLLFHFNFVNPIRRAKASLGLNYFGRGSGNTVLSKDGEYLFFRSTVAPNGRFSSYSYVSDSEVDFCVKKMNYIYDHFKAKGFDEMYFSVIPNPATILQPEGYNGLIPRIQKSAMLKVKVFDLFSVFSSSANPDVLYRKGDTHWSDYGMHIWIDMVNSEMVKY